VRPLSPSYVPNISQVWPVFQNPFYDQDWRYSVPYTVYTTGIGWRADKVKEDVAKLADPYEILWDSRYRGKVGVLDEYRETIGMVLLKNGITNLNTARPKHLELVRHDLRDLASATQPVIDVNAYQDLPPPQVRIDSILLVKQGHIPPNPTTAVVRQEYFETGFRAVELDPEVDKSWHAAWSEFKARL